MQQIIGGYCLARCLHVVADLGVADALGETPQTATALAAAPGLGLFAKQSVGSRQFSDAIVADQPISPNFYDGFKAQMVIDAALEAQQCGCWVSLL